MVETNGGLKFQHITSRSEIHKCHAVPEHVVYGQYIAAGEEPLYAGEEMGVRFNDLGWRQHLGNDIKNRHSWCGSFWIYTDGLWPVGYDPVAATI